MTRFCVKHGAGEEQESKRSSLRPTPSSLSDVTPAASNRIAMDILGKVTYNKLCQLLPVRKHPFPGTFKQICGCLLPSAASIPLLQHKKQVLRMVRRDSKSVSVDSGGSLQMICQVSGFASVDSGDFLRMFRQDFGFASVDSGDFLRMIRQDFGFASVDSGDFLRMFRPNFAFVSVGDWKFNNSC